MRNKWVKMALSLVLIAGLVSTFGLLGCGEKTPSVADFSASPTLGKSPLTVQFSDQSTGEISSWKWDFDSDGTVDSTNQNPTHAYSTAGTYTVSLTVTGADGADDTEVKVGYIRVGELLAGFTASPTSGIIPLTVQFTDQSVGEITSRSWNFGDGGTSTAQNPSHTYSTNGTYSVTLTVTGPAGSDEHVGATIEAGAVPQLQPATWKLSHGFPATGLRGKVANKFKELIEQVTGGKIKVDIYPNGTLFSAGNAPQALINGSVDVTFDPPYYWGTRIPWIPFLYLWGLFDSFEHATGVYTDPDWAVAMQERFGPVGAKYLGMTAESSLSLYVTNKAAVTDFKQMAGWKDGIPQGSGTNAGLIYIGFELVQVPWGQEQAALATGMIETYAMSLTSAVAYHSWEYAKYAIAGSLLTGSLIAMNPGVWNGLPAYWQNVIMTQVMPQVIKYANDEGKATEAGEIAQMTAGVQGVGGAFNTMTVAQMTTMREAQLKLDIVKAQMWDAGETIVDLILNWKPS
ncbi:MAG: hypothetical protein A2Y59_05030 [Chloroflexi bacterium RBG_13_52_14]|nr:MAG: hypothetical protein A2Y59_05030 [Chloroflexi bacterium RBG_13_52_14]